jgi:hypothetical protein
MVSALPKRGYVKTTGRMRRAVMAQLGLIRTKRHGHWKLIPVPPIPDRTYLYTPTMELAMESSGHSPETIALWEPAQELNEVYHFGDGRTAWQLEWQERLKLLWTPNTLPKCKGCEFETIQCSAKPPNFYCRVLGMASKHSLRPNQYWARMVELG